MPDETTPWVVKGVPQRIRKQVKLFAVEHDLTMAQAIEALVDMALGKPLNKPKNVSASKPYPRVSLEADEVVVGALVAQMTQGGKTSREYERYLRECVLNDVDEPMDYDTFVSRKRK